MSGKQTWKQERTQSPRHHPRHPRGRFTNLTYPSRFLMPVIFHNLLIFILGWTATATKVIGFSLPLNSGGFHEIKGIWSFLSALEEMPEGHTAEKQMMMILLQLQKVQEFQTELKLTITTLLDFKMVVFDNTSSNTGLMSGLAALLEKKRKLEWDALIQTGKASGEYSVLFFSSLPFLHFKIIIKYKF